ncbi:MAG: DUF4097 family beta strand repeat protein [Phycisphaerae bacterium]|nr:DUF4097 family beta strand repeat protein [Phycisphaerae bacterium]
MSSHRASGIVLIVAIAVAGSACETSIQTTLLDDSRTAGLSAPDGIDPRSPNIERCTEWIDFEGIKTIRIEIPTARVSVAQSDGNIGGSLKLKKYIVVEGLGNEALETLLINSQVTAERSFVDASRLDIEATLAEGLADADIVFDVSLVIPSGANIEVLLANGPVEVTDVTGNVEIVTANGAVVIDHVNGNVIARTSQRSIEATDVTGNIQAVTADADVTMRLAPSPEGCVVARTTAGTIRLNLDQSTSASLNLTASEGVISANLNGFDVTNIATGTGFLSGVLNGGGGQVEAHAPGGEIVFAGT